MADVNYAIPIITAGGTVLAAVITGFLAATLKHDWDVAESETTWTRERNERRRDEVREALIAYLDQRDGMQREVAEAFGNAAEATTFQRADTGPSIMKLIGQAHRLQLLLNRATSVKIGEDVTAFIEWYKAPPVSLDEQARLSITTPGAMRDFAREILKDLPLA
ncbi:hypothetical protein O2W15_01565 [Modestobacter sp. VKM Ac-2979]|uniref:hypothetical protein n=1 Tax=unclassified Modestobacter TaxID=2643866 RepID=UPI0022AB9957|nr:MULTISPECIES: hypothetical protein [unclassified Modestobacter]MCZ2810113.1 hypothetical protein [Modestobacter sp. VKM Ac-2979]MCZ2841599.1 hypothetical protein [Modestobacter sp. VKM Ac-2980]